MSSRARIAIALAAATFVLVGGCREPKPRVLSPEESKALEPKRDKPKVSEACQEACQLLESCKMESFDSCAANCVRQKREVVERVAALTCEGIKRMGVEGAKKAAEAGMGYSWGFARLHGDGCRAKGVQDCPPMQSCCDGDVPVAEGKKGECVAITECDHNAVPK